MIYVLDPVSKAVQARSHCEVEDLCFLLTITSIQTGRRDRAAIVRCAYELQSYITCAMDVKVEEVQLLCPPSVNGSDAWSLEHLEKIAFYEGIGTGESAVIYQTSGNTYKFGTLDLRKKKTRRIWYSEQHLFSRITQQSHRTLDMREPHFYASKVR
ncbi:hypothetical protein GMO17_05230 [Pseudomonas coronafaciens pv. coronafaciens]|uniref:Uncharacterized protein n=1 Tax=Pseudomonas coronafaciens pv. coronafaciens TaxID=235275 RepID=A0AAE6QG34_9PSED|nr:hypothetical protein GMO17_05230 [Pseudomonas coronafaciens pv. coronafaciens]